MLSDHEASESYLQLLVANTGATRINHLNILHQNYSEFIKLQYTNVKYHKFNEFTQSFQPIIQNSTHIKTLSLTDKARKTV